MKKVAIVILNWNGRKLMEEFLPSFRRIQLSGMGGGYRSR